MDFNFVSTRVATGGGIINDSDVQALVKAGITHIIDCRAEYDDSPLLVNYPQIGYLWNGVHDDGQHKPVAWFEKSIDFGLKALAIPGAKLYAHCSAGVNRGPSTAYAVLRATGLNPIQAESMIKAGRPIALILYMKDADAAITALKYE